MPDTCGDELSLCALLPSAVLQGRALLPSPHAFVATSLGSVIRLAGACAAELRSDGSQVLWSAAAEARPRLRPRLLCCCALSPCERYLAVGEELGARGESSQVLVFDRAGRAGGAGAGAVAHAALRGHAHGVRFLAWLAQGAWIASVGEMEAGSDHQLILWSWPQGERLVTSTCMRGVADLAAAPEAPTFVALGATAVRRWSWAPSKAAEGSRPPAAESCREAQVQLTSRALQLGEIIEVARCGSGGAKRHLDRFVAAAWDVATRLYLVSRAGLLCRLVDDEVAVCAELGYSVASMRWVEQLSSATPASGFLLCTVTSGAVQVVDVNTLRAVLSLPLPLPSVTAGPDPGPSHHVAAVSCPADGESMWVLCADGTLARMRGWSEATDWTLPAALPGLRDAHAPVGGDLQASTKMVTITDRALQLWTTSLDGGLRLEASVEPQSSRAMGDLTALACSEWLVACGRRRGDIQLLSLPALLPLEAAPAKHMSDVLGLAFGPWKPCSGAPLLLASCSRDRCAMLFRIDLRRGAVGVEASLITLLLRLPLQSAAIQGIALRSAAALPLSAAAAVEHGVVATGAPGAVLAFCTADQQLVMLELELGPWTATVRSSSKQVATGASWVGVVAHPTAPVFYAACSDRRFLRLEIGPGRRQQQARAVSHEAVLAAPLRLSADGRLLAVGLGAAAARPRSGVGVLLLDAGTLAPLARLLGHAESPTGFAFMPGDAAALVSCWSDGTMLQWKVAASADELRRRREGSPRQRQASSSRSLRTHASREAAAFTPCASAGDVPAALQAPDGAEAGDGPVPENLLEKLLASSPRPPRWAERQSAEVERSASMRGDVGDFEGGAEATTAAGGLASSASLSCLSDLSCISRSLADAAVPSPASATRLLGKWARFSKVGNTVRSASELQEVSDETEPPPSTTATARSAAPCGVAAVVRALSAATAPSFAPSASSPRLPPKPHHPPPTEQEPTHEPVRAAQPPSAFELARAKFGAVATPCRSRRLNHVEPPRGTVVDGSSTASLRRNVER